MEQTIPQPSRRSSRIQVWLPATIKPDGTVENIIQGQVENLGPQKGHWAKQPKSNGMISDWGNRRRWIDGQHNYNRQMDPKSHEPILGNRVMNRNPKMEPCLNQDKEPVNNLVDDARIIKLGVLVTRHETFFDRGFDDSMRRASKIVNSATKSKVQGGEHTGVGSVGALRK